MIPQGHQSEKGGHERRDADIPGVVLVATLVILITAISYLTVQGLMLFLKRADHRTAARAPHSVAQESNSPQPRLQVNPTTDLFLSQENSNSELHSYGWIDRKAGIVHIPIERAMELLMERGLPEVGAGQTRLQLMQARPSTDVQPANPLASPAAEGSPSG